jgi:glycosyltransferase involved in cell wall biosynthesis
VTDPRYGGLRVAGFVTSPERRGAEVFAHTVLSRLGEAGAIAELWAIQPGSSAAQLDIDHLGRSRFDPRVVARARSIALRSDVVVAFGGSALQLAALATVGTGVPFAYRQIGDPAFWGRVRFADQRIGLPMRRAAAVVALWGEAGDVLERRYRLAPGRVQVIPNARDRSRYQPVDSAARVAAQLALGLPAGPTVVYLGAMSWEKRPEDAVRAVAQVPGVQLVMAGDGPLRAGLEELAGALAPGRVRFLGVVADSRSVLDAADVLVCTSATEGMAGCLLEAGLCGVPVVATRVGAAAEVVVHGQTGVLVDVDAPHEVAAGIEQVLANRHPMATAIRRRTAERFSFDRVTPAWGDLLARLAMSSGRGPSIRSAGEGTT